MGTLLRQIISILDPLGVIRRANFLLPVANVYEELRRKVNIKPGTLKSQVLRVAGIICAASVIVWGATFMYAAFYYAYMPTNSHTRPVHMQFKTNLDTNARLSFPQAQVALTQKQQLLMVGQAYRVLVDIEMPETPQNLEQGMFMVCVEMRDQSSKPNSRACRTAMMHYRSPLIRSISTLALSPLYVLGLKEESQNVHVEIFSQYLEKRQSPITDVYVEIQSKQIHFYKVSLHIVADFTGLRYVMFNWPRLSAFVGIGINLFFISTVFFLSWFHGYEAIALHKLQQKQCRKIMPSPPNKSVNSRRQDNFSTGSRVVNANEELQKKFEYEMSQ